MDKVIEQKRGLKKKHIPYLIGGALALLFIGWLIFGNHSSTLRVEKDKITIEEVRKGTFNDYIRIMGNVEPIMFFQLSALEGGRVVEKIVEEGAMVKKGDIIVKLENPNLSMEILKSEADLAYQENELRNTLLSMEKEKLSIRQERLQSELTVTRNKRKYDQNKKLYEEDLIAKEDYLTAKEDYETSVENNKMLIERQKQDSIYREIQVENMQESLNNMRRNLKLVRERNDNLNVKAPISGQLGTLSVEIGQSVSSGMEIGKINVLDNYKVVAQIDEHYIDRVRKDLEASLERQGTNFNMKVLKVYPDVKGGQFKTDLCFVGEMPENVRTGQTYHINLQLGQADESVLIPRGASIKAPAVNGYSYFRRMAAKLTAAQSRSANKTRSIIR